MLNRIKKYPYSLLYYQIYYPTIVNIPTKLYLVINGNRSLKDIYKDYVITAYESFRYF